jgi:hypothetical protein
VLGGHHQVDAITCTGQVTVTEDDRFPPTGDLGCVVVAELKKNAPPDSLSKTRVFERVCRTGKVTGKSGLTLS